MIATSDVLERVNWQPWDLGLNRYLDRSFTNRMQTKAYPCKFKYIQNCREQAADLVDIKTDTNMWSVEQLAEATGRVYSVDSSVFENTFPDLRDKLNQQDNG
jgi:DNA-binding GntR family transcriptional regulator